MMHKFFRKTKLSGKVSFWKYIDVYTDEWGDENLIFISHTPELDMEHMGIQMTPFDEPIDFDNYISSMDLDKCSEDEFNQGTTHIVFPDNFDDINRMGLC
jgi:hypothetical protein